jgi:hypothetical protein
MPLLAGEAPQVKLALQDLDQFQTQLGGGELDAVIVTDVPMRRGCTSECWCGKNA